MSFPHLLSLLLLEWYKNFALTLTYIYKTYITFIIQQKLLLESVRFVWVQIKNSMFIFNNSRIIFDSSAWKLLDEVSAFD